MKKIILKKNYSREKIFNRILELLKSGYFIEAFLFEFSIIESVLIKIIKEYGKVTEDVFLKKKIKFNFKELCEKDLNQITFGKLIHCLKIFNDDVLLIKKLELLNSLRINCVHKILLNDIEDLNQEIKTKSTEHQKLLDYLLDTLIVLMVYPSKLEFPMAKLD